MFKTINDDKKAIIFSDVDGTIYTSNFTPSEETKQDIKFAIDNQSIFNICTGNPYLERMQWLGKMLQPNYIIASSGAQIVDFKNNEIIHSEHISFNLFNEIITICKTYNIPAVFWDNENYFILSKSHQWTNEIMSYHFVNQETRNRIPKEYSNEKIQPCKIELYPPEYVRSNKKVDEIYQLVKHLSKKLTLIRTSVNIEITPKDVDKAFAIKWMAKNIYPGENIKDFMTIGDSNNDLAMLKLTDYSYAMANSSADLLKVSKYFTSSVEQNGVGEAILDYLYRFKNIAREHLLHKFGKKEN